MPASDTPTPESDAPSSVPSATPAASGPPVMRPSDPQEPRKLTRKEKREQREEELKKMPPLKRFWLGWVKPILIVVVVVTVVRSMVIDWNDVPTGSMNPTIVEGDRVLVNKLAYGVKPPLSHGLPLFFTGIEIPLYGPLADKSIATWSEPQRGDIVTFWSPADGKRMIKRIVAEPGDLVRMREGRLEIKPEGGEWVPAERRLIQSATPPTTLTSGPNNAYVAKPVVRYEESILGQTRTIQHLIETNDRDVQRRIYERPQMRNFELKQPLADDEYFMIGDNRDNSHDSRFFGPVKRQAITGQAMRIAWSLDSDSFYMPRWGRTFGKLEFQPGSE